MRQENGKSADEKECGRVQSDGAERYGSYCLGVTTGSPLRAVEWGDGDSPPVHKKGRASLPGGWERCHHVRLL